MNCNIGRKIVLLIMLYLTICRVILLQTLSHLCWTAMFHFVLQLSLLNPIRRMDTYRGSFSAKIPGSLSPRESLKAASILGERNAYFLCRVNVYPSDVTRVTCVNWGPTHRLPYCKYSSCFYCMHCDIILQPSLFVVFAVHFAPYLTDANMSSRS